MLICAHCGSQSIVHDMEYVAGKGWIEEPRCLKCGRMQFKTAKQEKQELKNLEINEIINSGKTEKEEKDMGLSTTGKCEACGVRNTVAGYLCPECFQARHCITVQEYKDNKRYRTETPAKVAARITGKVIEKPAPAEVKETKAPETKPITVEDVVSKIETMPDITEDDKTVLMHLYSEGPFLIVILPPEIKDALAKRAKAEYRTPELEAAYILHKELSA